MRKLAAIIFTLFALTFAFTLVACGNDSGNGSDTPANIPAQVPDQNNDSDRNTNITDNDTGEEDTAEEDTSEEDSGDAGLQGSDNLYEIGADATAFISNNRVDPHRVTMRINKTIRGDDAIDYINEQLSASGSMWQARAYRDEDFEYLLAEITFTLEEYEADETMRPVRLRLMASDFSPYPALVATTFYTDDFPDLTTLDLSVGETVTAYKIFIVSKDDDSPYISYEGLRSVEEGLWFKTN